MSDKLYVAVDKDCWEMDKMIALPPDDQGWSANPDMQEEIDSAIAAKPGAEFIILEVRAVAMVRQETKVEKL